jgi:hypothetical protein
MRNACPSPTTAGRFDAWDTTLADGSGVDLGARLPAGIAKRAAPAARRGMAALGRPSPAACADHGRQAITVAEIRPCVAERSPAYSSDGVLAADRWRACPGRRCWRACAWFGDESRSASLPVVRTRAFLALPHRDVECPTHPICHPRRGEPPMPGCGRAQVPARQAGRERLSLQEGRGQGRLSACQGPRLPLQDRSVTYVAVSPQCPAPSTSTRQEITGTVHGLAGDTKARCELTRTAAVRKRPFESERQLDLAAGEGPSDGFYPDPPSPDW